MDGVPEDTRYVGRIHASLVLERCQKICESAASRGKGAQILIEDLCEKSVHKLRERSIPPGLQEADDCGIKHRHGSATRITEGGVAPGLHDVPA
jgi:hypothetical protein